MHPAQPATFGWLTGTAGATIANSAKLILPSRRHLKYNCGFPRGLGGSEQIAEAVAGRAGILQRGASGLAASLVSQNRKASRKRMTKLATRLPQLDGLRAVAILLVIVGHIIGYSGLARLSVLGEVASLGVDLFFVLSGFLITGILVRSKGTDRYFVNFFGRRALRIWPLYYAFLAAMYVFGVVISVPDWNFRGYNLGWYAVYAQALRYPAGIGPDPISVTWSLAIEEQFYVVWPFVVATASTSTLRRISWLIVLAAPLFRLMYLHYGLNAYIAFACRADAIALGSLVALWNLERKDPVRSSARVAGAAVALFGAATALCAVTALRQVLAHSLSSAMFAATLIFVLKGGGESARVLRWRPLRYVGEVSYCLYLVYLPTVMILRHYVPSRWALCFVSVGASLLLAEASRRHFEGPILALKDRWFAMRDRTSSAPEADSTVASSNRPQRVEAV
jgi:peptidoglycan/LPS O-acetylase OafA/YrhL